MARVTEIDGIETVFYERESDVTHINLTERDISIIEQLPKDRKYSIRYMKSFNHYYLIRTYGPRAYEKILISYYNADCPIEDTE